MYSSIHSTLKKNCSISNIAIFFLCIICINCTQTVKKVEGDDIPIIDVISNISKAQKVNLSSIASSIEYCMLETDEKCLIRNKSIIYSSGDFFVYMSTHASWPECYVFDRKTGKFVRQISRTGQGPNDYQRTAMVLDGEIGQICLVGNNQYHFYNHDGSLSHKTKIFANFFIAYEDLYICYVNNTKGDSKTRINFHDRKTGELIDSIPNYRFYKRDEGRPFSTGGDFSFHLFNNNLYYKDIYCDTLYQIKDFSLEPRYIFNTGSQTVPYESQKEGRVDIQAAMAGRECDRYSKYIVINRLFESTNYLIFTFDYRNRKYPVLFDKPEEKIQILLPVSIPLLFLRDGLIPLYGFENDLDGGLPFWPQEMISEKEMMCVYTAEELLELDASKISDEKLKNVLNSLEEDSNPVVAIVTLKD